MFGPCTAAVNHRYETGSRYTAAFLKPVISKLDPHLIHRATYQLAVARSYARTMLGLRRLSPEDQEDQEKREDHSGLVDHLIEHYPAHEYVISRSEAADLPLPVRYAENYDRWFQVRQLHLLFQFGLATSSDLLSLIEVWPDAEVEDRLRQYLGEDHEEEDASPDAPNEDEGEPPGGGGDEAPADPGGTGA